MKQSILLIGFFAFFLSAYAQDTSDKKAIEGWHNLDRVSDQYMGVSSTKAYEFLKGKDSRTIIVAVIDAGVDINHEDLVGNIWVNEGEIAGNGIDDDKNGYVDDVHGWNFIGDVVHDTYEATRMFVMYSTRFEDKTADQISKSDKKDFDQYMSLKSEIKRQVEENQSQLTSVSNFSVMFQKSNRLMKAYLDTEEVTIELLTGVSSTDAKITGARDMVKYALETGFNEQEILDYLDHLHIILDYGYNLEFDPRPTIGDNFEDVYEKYYGNSTLYYDDQSHGTQVAGVIAAKRGNNIGIDGIADNVKIMAIRAVPDGDERDKDIANAIIYAVDNGAHIINMSFGKRFSPRKEAVDKAIQYAESKGVLLIHASGNDGKDIDIRDNFPTRTYSNSNKSAKGWLEIGASSWGDGSNFVASFSNYGKKTVDVFAPGVAIYSTSPGNTYDSVDGTSFASPLTAGVAALVMSYYPELDSKQVAKLIMDSSIKFLDLEVNKPGEYEGEPDMIKFSELSRSGGIINAYEAVKMAESMKVGSKN